MAQLPLATSASSLSSCGPETPQISRCLQAITPLTVIAAACVFVCVQVGFGRVSSIGPDLLVTCLLFLASGFVLRFTLHPSPHNGALLGLTLGLGYLAKAVFLPLSVILLATALLPRRLRPASSLQRAPCLVVAAAALRRRAFLGDRPSDHRRIRASELRIPRQPAPPLDGLARRSLPKRRPARLSCASRPSVARTPRRLRLR